MQKSTNDNQCDFCGALTSTPCECFIEANECEDNDFFYDEEDYE